MVNEEAMHALMQVMLSRTLNLGIQLKLQWNIASVFIYLSTEKRNLSILPSDKLCPLLSCLLCRCPWRTKYIDLVVDRYRGLSLGTSPSHWIFYQHSTAPRIMPLDCAVWVNWMSSYVMHPPDGGSPIGPKKPGFRSMGLLLIFECRNCLECQVIELLQKNVIKKLLNKWS